MPLPDYESRLVFARELQSGIGSSDAPELMGVGFSGPSRVWHSKFCPLDEIAQIPQDGRLRRGLMLEHMVAEEYRLLTDQELVPAARVRHIDREWQRCSPDRRRKSDGTMVELKAIDFFDETWGGMLSDRVPDKYRVQVTHQMGVCGEDRIHLCATAVLTWETRIYTIPFDANLFAYITDVESRFWHDHVLTKIPPPAGWEDKHKTDYKDRSSVPDKSVVLAEEIGELCARRALLKGLIKEADTEIDEIGLRLLDEMGDAHRAIAGMWHLTKRHTKGTDKRRESYWVDAKKIEGQA